MLKYEIYDEKIIPRHLSNKQKNNLKAGTYVYLLIVDNHVVYVGQSTRHYFHRVILHRSHLKFDKFIIIDFLKQNEFDDLDDMEQYFIWKYNPILNNGFTTRIERDLPVDWNRSFDMVCELLGIKRYQEKQIKLAW